MVSVPDGSDMVNSVAPSVSMASVNVPQPNMDPSIDTSGIIAHTPGTVHLVGLHVKEYFRTTYIPITVADTGFEGARLHKIFKLTDFGLSFTLKKT